MLEWCRDVHNLERLLKVLTEIKAKEKTIATG